MAWLTIYEAAEILAVRAGRPVTPTGFKHILMAGAECRLRVFWRNSQQLFSCLLGFRREVPDSTQVIREMELFPWALAQLETREEIDLFVFQPTDHDCLLLQKDQSIDDDGDPGGFRALIDVDRARVARNELFVQDHEVFELAQQTLPRDKRLESRSAGPSHDVEPRSASDDWSIKEPRRSRGYTPAVFRLLAVAHKEGKAPPTARQMLEQWRAKQPPEIYEVMADAIKYYDSAGTSMREADLNAIGMTIRRMVKRYPTTLRPR